MVSNWPKINDPLVTTLDKFAGDYLNRLSDYFAGVDIGLADANWNPYIITKTKYGNTSLQIADLTASAFYVTIQGRNATLTANKTVQVPDMGATATDEMLLRTNVAAITGKTFDLASNVLPETGKSLGAILKYDGTEYTGLPRGTANQVLVTNAGATDVLWATLAKVNLPATIVHTDQTNTWGAFDQIFPSGRFYILNPAGTFKYKVVGSAITADRQATEPLLIADDVRVYQDHNQDVTNKGVDLNKNRVQRLMRYGAYPCAIERGVDSYGALRGMVGLGVQGTTGLDSRGSRHDWIAFASVAGDTYGVVKFDHAIGSRFQLPRLIMHIVYRENITVQGHRLFYGFGPQRLLDLSDTVPVTNTEHCFIMGHGNADTQFQIWHNDGTGAVVKESTGVNIPAVDTNYFFEVKSQDTSVGSTTTAFTWTIYNSGNDGSIGSVIATGNVTTRIPAQSTALYLHAVEQWVVTSAKNLMSIRGMELFSN